MDSVPPSAENNLHGCQEAFAGARLTPVTTFSAIILNWHVTPALYTASCSPAFFFLKNKYFLLLVWFCSVIKLHVLELPKTSCAEPRLGDALVLRRESSWHCCSSNPVLFQLFPARPPTRFQFASYFSSFLHVIHIKMFILCLFSDSSSHSPKVEDGVSGQPQCALHSLQMIVSCHLRKQTRQ